MNTKALYGAIAVIALLIIGLFLYNQSQEDTLSNTAQTNNANTESSPTNVNSNISGNSNTSANTNDSGQMSGEGDIAGATHLITFDGTKYTPSTLTIKQGDTVVFKNSSTKDFWPASAQHPTHTVYPEFDADKGIAPGGIYSFTFAKVGEWGFHDHLTPTAFGKITVQ